ncbi:MAG TPA: hypothetical protein VMY42_24290 [Thermoguttaceae bacterium]|nr:hypothetical protein [Thermoguttaceae bacterium]
MDDFPNHLPQEPPAVPPPLSTRTNKAPPRDAPPGRGLVRFLYCQNPFYVVSAVLVFWGLRASFDSGGETFQSGALLAALAGYTILLAATAFLLIRFGKVWQDVRTVLLVIVLMFLAISISFEKTLVTNPPVGRLCLLGGLAFAILCSEGLLRGIRLKLPPWFRASYYSILALFFLYPVILNPAVVDPNDPKLTWGLFGFSPLAGVAFLTLLPAVRRGPQYVRDNGNPWPWPLYPWVLFGFLGLGVCGRTYSLCLSFQPMKGSATIFAPYFLVPFLFSVNVLLMEIGMVSRLKGVMRVALIAPVGLLALAAGGPGSSETAAGFFQTFRHALGASPLFVTLLAVAAFYLVAWLRRVPYATTALTASLAAAAVCGPDTVGLSTRISPQGFPLLLIGLLQLWIALRQRSSWRCLLAMGCFVAAMTCAFWETSFTAYRGLIPIHVSLAAVLLVGALFSDPFAKLLQRLGAALILLAGIAALVLDPQWLGHPPPMLLAAYPGLVIATAIVYGYLAGNRWYYAAASGNLICWLVVAGRHVYVHLRQTIAGLDQIAWGIAFFLVAVLISLTKTDIPRKCVSYWRKRN